MGLKQRHLYVTDEDFITAVRENDELGMRIMYKNYFQLILNLIVNNNGTEQEAKDIYQESFIILIESLKDETFVLNCKIKTYLYSVSRRLWLKELTKKSRKAGRFSDFEEFIPIEEESSADLFEKDKRFKVLNESLEEIGEPCRTILEGFYIEKLSMTEIANKMGYTNADNAKNQKYKCFKRLQKLVFKNLRITRELENDL